MLGSLARVGVRANSCRRKVLACRKVFSPLIRYLSLSCSPNSILIIDELNVQNLPLEILLFEFLVFSCLPWFHPRDPSHFIEGYVFIRPHVLQDKVEFLNLIW